MDNYENNDSVKIGLSDIINGAVLLFGLTAFCMLFVDCVKCVKVVNLIGSETVCFKGYEIAFGGAHVLTFSFFNFLPFLFVLAASVLVGLKFFGIKLDFKVIDADWVIAALFGFATVFFFISPVTLRFSSDATAFKNGRSFYMAAGLIVASILSLLSALVLAAQKTLQILIKKGVINVKQ